MKRDNYIARLAAWKSSSRRKPLILEGARQVGKTWLMKEFAKTYYENVVYARFDKDKVLRSIFERDFDMNRIVRDLETLFRTRIDAENTVLLFDEIQSCKNALTSLKYFCEEARAYHVIAAGSLLGVTMHQGLGFPVGKIDQINLKPMSFSEFLLASNQEKYLNLISQPPTA